METVSTVISLSLTPANILFVSLGIFVGYIVGAIPGMGKATAAAIAIPLTYSMNPVSAIGFLVGIAKGSTAGNAVSAILINTPGEPSSVPTALDGYPLAKQGKGRKALKVALIASTFGDFLATWLLVFLTTPIAKFTVQIGKVELAAILIFSLTFIAALSGKSLSKGLIAGLIGIILATAGLEPETAVQRLTFGSIRMLDGLPLIAIAIGIVAVSEMVLQLEEHIKARHSGEVISAPETPNNSISGSEWRRLVRPILGGTTIGSSVGILPGLGAAIASFASYGLAQRLSKDPESFGKGNIEGVAAAESADNAVIPSSLIPLLALGIPGSVIAAILAAGFTMHGIIPGPMVMRDSPDFVLGLFGSLLLASPLMLLIGFLGMRLFIKVIAVPFPYLFSGVLFFSITGAYLQAGETFGVYVMIAFGLVGYFLKKFQFPFVTFIIGFIIGPQMELAIRQSIIITKGQSLTEFPVAIAFIILTVLIVARVGWSTVVRIKKGETRQVNR